jgi:DNA polymerase-3 subunit beta
VEFKIKKADFLNLLKWPQGIVEKRGTMPILSNILLESIEKGELKVTATDLEISLVAEGIADIRSPGKVVLNARNLYEIVKESPDETILVTGREAHGVEIKSGKAKFRMVGMNPEEFPKLPQITRKDATSNGTVIDAEDLEEMIAKTFYATSSDETRYTLSGLYWVKVTKAGKSYLRLVATDGHRLAYDERESSQWNLPKGIIVPRKGIVELKNLLSTGAGDLFISVDERSVIFQKGKVTLIVRLVEGEFPSYELVIPQSSDKIISVDRTLLSGALRRASIMTSDQVKGVRMSFGSGLLEVSSSHPDLGEAREELAIDYKGANFQVGFNPRYFLDILNAVEDEKVILELKDEVSACVVRSEFDRGFLALVMPMRI